MSSSHVIIILNIQISQGYVATLLR